MATQARKPELHRIVSFVISLLLIAPQAAESGDLSPSQYTPFAGDRFYLLSESNFSSDDTAKVRLEVAGGRHGLEAYSGVDVRIYRIPKPIEFLRKQKNLHRPVLKGNYAGEGLSNALSYLWDSWYKKSRLAWQRVFSSEAREAAVSQAPELKQTPPHTYQTKFQNHPQFRPIAGLDLIDEYRYPVWDAQGIAPPAGVNLSGSSSRFLEKKEGNVYVPLGRQKPGLYLVEALIGSFRAVTFVFVSDTVAITKLSGNQELVWTVGKKDGRPIAGSRLLFTDGVGVLGEGKTGADGVYTLKGKNLERSYVLGQDAQGGVFISENYYYDSEILGTKLYIHTDRPLYRPGDEVHVKFFGRDFVSSRKSNPLASSPVSVAVSDSHGTSFFTRKLSLASGNDGGDFSFRLPELAPSGGYTLRVEQGSSAYVAAFRVNNYVKPHFEAEIQFSKPEFVANEPVSGKVALHYSNGDPVDGATVEIEVRKQRLTIVEGELQYLDRFPARVLKDSSLSKKGMAEFKIPATNEPTRYLISARAVDDAAYRVSVTKELLVNAVMAPRQIHTERRYGEPGEEIRFQLSHALGSVPATPVASWEAIRLQDQHTLKGSLESSAQDFHVQFEKPGAYTLMVRDTAGQVVGSTNYWVKGPELAYIPGSISILLDQEEYRSGEKAKVHVTFSEDVNEALVTLERDQVEKHALLSSGASWVNLKRISAREFSGEITIDEDFIPNITLSVAYVSGGRYHFENKGLKVATPQVQIAFRPNQAEYKPGEIVKVDVETLFEGKPVEAVLSVSVVDEMIYTLQPEIAPEFPEFLFHPRRNQVRTTSSLSFHSYDVAASATGASPTTSSDYSERSLKLRDRPRREDKDTAFWEPKLKTDRNGKTSFIFKMPDSLTRWRITGRALASNGFAGQRKDYILSQKDAYLKWNGPQAFRRGDASEVSVALFNLTGSEKKVTLETKGPGTTSSREVTLKPGANYQTVPLKAEESGDLLLTLKEKESLLDQLQVPILIAPTGWVSTLTKRMSPDDLTVPAGAFNLRVNAAQAGSDVFFRAVDYLSEYPYGCVEQTSSRLLPLALAYGSVQQLGLSEKVADRMRNRVLNERLRLVKMAGPQAKFAWWGNETETSAFMTAYAYYADFVASRALGIQLPSSHWERVLKAYEEHGEKEPALNRALILWMAAEMGLPIKTLAQGAIEKIAKDGAAGEMSPLFASEETESAIATDLLLEVLSKRAGVPLPQNLASRGAESKQKALTSSAPFVRAAHALSLGSSGMTAEQRASVEGVLDQLLIEGPTIQRALALTFVQSALGAPKSSSGLPALSGGAGWSKAESRLGREQWQYTGKTSVDPLPSSLVPAGASVHLVYDSMAPEKSGLPIQIDRKITKLGWVGDQKTGEGYYVMESGKNAGRFSTKDLYLDEVTLTPKEGDLYRFGLVEVGLPAGGEVEESSWGISVRKEGKTAVDEPLLIGNDSLQLRDHSYSIALEKLDQPVTVRQLVRFGQQGSFSVPPARYFRMYSPDRKAYEGGGSSAVRKIQVQ